MPAGVCIQSVRSTTAISLYAKMEKTAHDAEIKFAKDMGFDDLANEITKIRDCVIAEIEGGEIW